MSEFADSPCPQPMPPMSQAAINNLLYTSGIYSQQSDDLYGQLTARVVQWIADALKTQLDAQTAIASKIAVPIASGLAAQATAIDQIHGALASSLQSGLATIGASGPGGSVAAGVQPGQYTHNVFSTQLGGKWVPYQIVSKQVAIELAGQVGFCFLGGWEDYYDAVAYQNSAEGQAALTQCTYPGGPAAPLPPPTGTGGCQQWAVWVFPSGSTSLCSFPYCDGTVPDPSGLGGHKVLFPDQASATAFASSQTCQSGNGTGGGPQYYAGCGSDGQPVSWQAGTSPPAGVTGQVGPYDTQAAALAAVGQCAPPPPPPTGGPTGGNGTGCCDPTTGAVKLPDCIMLDLCDWDKFTQAVYKALCLWTKDPSCKCALEDADKYKMEDCPNSFNEGVAGWLGNLGGVVIQADTVDQLVSQGAGAMDGIG